MNKKHLTYFSIIVLAIGLVFLANGFILAWTPPTTAPPGGNVAAQLNVSGTEQSKTGRLGVSTSDADNSYGLTVGTNNTYGIKSDRNSWIAGWGINDNYLYEDGENVIQTTDEWLRLNQSGNFSNGIYTPGTLRVDGMLLANGGIRSDSGQLMFWDDVRITGGLTVDGPLLAPAGIFTQTLFARNGIQNDSSNSGGRLILNDPQGTSVTTLCFGSDCRSSWPSTSVGTNSVGSAQVIDNSLTAADLAANSVGSSEVVNNSLTALDLAGNSVGNSELIDSPTFPGTVRTARLQDYNHSSYYVDPYGTSVVRDITASSIVFSGQTGPTCMFFRGCPSGWVNRGQAGFLQLLGGCPYTTGGHFSGSWYWCHPYLCCTP